MRFHSCLLFLFLFFVSLSPGGEPLPTWLAEQLSDPTVIAKPGVYALKDSRLLGVGQGKVHESLRDTRGQRTALNLAEYDAKQRVSSHTSGLVFTNCCEDAIKMYSPRNEANQEIGKNDGISAYSQRGPSLQHSHSTPVGATSDKINAKENIILRVTPDM